MAKEEEREPKETREREGGKKDGEGEREEGRKEKKPKKHLHSIRTEATTDHKGKVTGYISHHTYKAKATDHHTEPEKPMAVHDSADEAGQHLAEQFGAQEGGAGGAQEPEEEAQGGAEPAEGAAPQAGM